MNTSAIRPTFSASTTPYEGPNIAGNDFSLCWHAEATVWGLKARAHFFNPYLVDRQQDFVARCLPVFRKGRPMLLSTEINRRNFRVGELVAQPDAVLKHGEGLLVLEYKSRRQRLSERRDWAEQLDLRVLLQTVIAAIAVAAESNRTTVPVLRLYDAVLWLSPTDQLVEILTASVPAARNYYQETRAVSASQLAAYCEAIVRTRWPLQNAAALRRSAAGRVRHDTMLRTGELLAAPMGLQSSTLVR